MSDDTIVVTKGTVYYYLKKGKEKIATALTLEGLEKIIREEHDANVDYLTAIDIARSKNR